MTDGHNDHDSAKAAQEAQDKCSELWMRAGPVRATHPYVQSNGIRPFGAKQLRAILLIPLRDAAGILRNLQFIQPDGSMRFKTGGVTAECYCAIGGRPGEGAPLLVCERWATACCLHEDTGYPVAAAMSAENVPAVATAMRAKFPHVQVIPVTTDDEER